MRLRHHVADSLHVDSLGDNAMVQMIPVGSSARRAALLARVRRAVVGSLGLHRLRSVLVRG